MLKYTGHPLIDVGIATITALAEKFEPADLTDADLEQVAEYLTSEYTRQPMKSFLTVAFPNSGFTQPAFESTPERRLDYARRVLGAYRSDVPTLDDRCVFTDEPAVALAFDVKDCLPLGRTFRQHVPLLTGENVINFHPYGQAGLPISGKALLAVQAFPLGCAKCGGRLLAVHSDNTDLIYCFAAAFLERNQRAINLAQQEGSSKLAEAEFSHRTLLIKTLLDIRAHQRQAHKKEQPFSLTVYHLSNSGQGVKLDLYDLPLEIMGFLQDMYSARYQALWLAIVARAWEVAPKKKGGKQDGKPFQPRRNWLYEDIFGLPGNAHMFLRTYFLRQALHHARVEQGDPRGTYSLDNESSLVSWDITGCFLRRIMHMEKERVEQIRVMADRLADYAREQNDRRFFRDLFTLQRYDDLRTALLKANLAHVKKGNPPLITLDPYIEVFEEGDEVARSDWRLARDLVLIRMIERLYECEKEWLGSSLAAVAETSDVNSATP